FKGMSAEIQVRTVLQHAWAGISHKLQYKRENEIPKEFRRRLVRRAGLRELEDGEFADLKRDQSELANKVANKIGREDLTVGINLDSVVEFLSSSMVAEAVEGAARSARFEVVEGDAGRELTAVAQIVGIESLHSL